MPPTKYKVVPPHVDPITGVQTKAALQEKIKAMVSAELDRLYGKMVGSTHESMTLEDLQKIKALNEMVEVWQDQGGKVDQELLKMLMEEDGE